MSEACKMGDGAEVCLPPSTITLAALAGRSPSCRPSFRPTLAIRSISSVQTEDSCFDLQSLYRRTKDSFILIYSVLSVTSHRLCIERLSDLNVLIAVKPTQHGYCWRCEHPSRCRRQVLPVPVSELRPPPFHHIHWASLACPS